MDKNSPEDVIQIQEYYNEDKWFVRFMEWLHKEGYIIYGLEDHSEADEDSFYIVIGNSERDCSGNIKHACIYKNGKLYHDPLEGGNGLVTEEEFEVIKKVI